jgi:hypothetical protein
LLVNAHKKALQIEFQNVTILCVIGGTLSNKFINPLYAKMSAFACAATVTIVDKLFFEQMIELANYKMMNHPITKIGCKNFSFYPVGFISVK